MARLAEAAAERLNRRKARLLAAFAVLAAIAAVPTVLQPRLVKQRAPPVQLSAEAPSDGAVSEASLLGVFREAMSEVEALQQKVSAGSVVAQFGEKAAGIWESSNELSPVLAEAIDGALHALFLQQLGMLRHETRQKFEAAGHHYDVLRAADEAFVEQASQLVRPGSEWSIEQERSMLHQSLMTVFRRDAALLEERALAAKAQQATIGTIGRLQGQMEQLAQKVQSMRSASPWVFSTSYRIPKTPLQVVAKYSQGRANVELNLTPDRDPANNENGFVQSFGPANIGVSFNLGL